MGLSSLRSLQRKQRSEPAEGRWTLPRGWRLLSLALLGLSAPGALAQTLSAIGVNSPGVNDSSCRTMEVPVVYAITLIVGLGTFIGLHLVKRRLTKEGWSLANALSEPTRLTIPVDWRWTESAGDRESIGPQSSAAGKTIRSADGTPIGMTLLEASSSRMLAILGGFAILMLYMGFGLFALYSFGLTCQLPASMPAVTTFLLSGLSLFAPYVANKISTAIQPGIRSASRGSTPASTPAPFHSEPTAPAPPVVSSPSAFAATAAPPAVAVANSASSPARRTPIAPPPTARPTATLPVLSAPEHRPTAPPTAHREAAPKPPAPPAAPPAARGPSPWGREYGPAMDLIRSFEGFVDHAYPDPATGAEPWTIGYGFTTLNGRPVQPGQTLSRGEADAELQRQAQACTNHLAATIPAWQQMNGNQRSALLDFAWNLGSDFYGDEANFASISRDLRTRDWAQVPQTLLLYCDPCTAVEAGLLRRRQAEARLWTTPVAAGESTASAPAPAPAAPPATAHSHGSPYGNPLKVPYSDQLLMADGQGWRECFSASSSMLAMYWGKEPDENVYDKLRARYGDSTTSDAQLDALRSLGLKADFRTDGTVAMLKEEIDAGRPVAVGWLCDGPVSAPSGGGHWIVIIGYDNTGFFVNDPYGNCDLVDGGYLSHHDGAGLHYSYENWVPRWRVEGTGGWMLTCRA
ncbi:MAG: glycoside hydrolase family protein [Cyanobium sp.]